MNAFSAVEVRKRFPILSRMVNGRPLTYLDNAATTQKPDVVIASLVAYYTECNSNVHRATHTLADEATQRFEAARANVKQWINAAANEEIIWTRGATEAINIVANGLRDRLGPGDEILTTIVEHHSNFVPWQMLAQHTGATLRVVPINASGELDLVVLDQFLSSRTRIFAFGHVSNALGTVHPIGELISRAKTWGAITLVDGAQAMAHQRVDVQALGCDFYAFSGHKMYGPTGIGVLYGRREVLESLTPTQFGGEMISRVTTAKTTFNELPYRFEAGTPNIADAIGLSAAIDFLASLQASAIATHEDALRLRTEAMLRQIEGVQIIGEARHKAPVVSFTMRGGHPHDVATLLDQQGVAVRAGHHCAMPLMEALGLPGTVRASFALYNTEEDVDALVAAVHKVRGML